MSDYQGNNGGKSADSTQGDARTAATQARDGGAGGIPNYTELMNAILQMQKAQVQLPQDVQLAIDNQALDQLGAQKSMQALNRGPIAQAAAAQLADQSGQVAATGNLKATRKAALNSAITGADVANQESAANGQIAGQATLAEHGNKLREFVLQGKAHHANMQIQNNAAAMAGGVNNANDQGIMAVRQAGNGAMSTIDQIGLSGSMEQWGNTMAMVRGGLSALGAAASTYAGMDKGGNRQDYDPYGKDDASSNSVIDTNNDAGASDFEYT